MVLINTDTAGGIQSLEKQVGQEEEAVEERSMMNARYIHVL